MQTKKEKMGVEGKKPSSKSRLPLRSLIQFYMRKQLLLFPNELRGTLVLNLVNTGKRADYCLLFYLSPYIIQRCNKNA